jgi:Zn finger protein HypA/HybF involved in hydrogenase expression
MHDYDTVQALIDRLREIPGDVVEVRIRVGPTFTPEALQQAYEMLTLGSPLEDSKLFVDEALDVRRCDVCDEVWKVRREYVVGHMLICPACDAPMPLERGAAVEIVEIVTAT